MSDILIKNMEMPKEGCHHTLSIYADGSVEIGSKNNYMAIELPPHGRLIDADKLAKSLELWGYSAVDRYCTMTISNAIVKEILSQAPTVLEANHE